VVKLLNHDLTIFQDRLPRIQRKPTLEDRGAPEPQTRYPYQCQAINGDKFSAVGWLCMHLSGKSNFLDSGAELSDTNALPLSGD